MGGQDGLQTAPDLAVSKGSVLFARPEIYVARWKGRAYPRARQKGHGGEARRDYGLSCYGHPFLDGNGRAIMLAHGVLAQRAGFSIDWAATQKTEYLSALT